MAANISKEDVIEFISNLTVLELSELVKELEEKFGVSAAAPVALAAAAPVGQGQEEAVEPTEFDVILTVCDTEYTPPTIENIGESALFVFEYI